MSDVIIRLATPAEHDRLEALQLRASLAWEEHRKALLAHPDAVELPIEDILEGRTFVADRGGELVGFSVVIRRDDGEAELDGLFVDPPAWGNGIGAQLLLRAEHAARDGRAMILWVVSGLQAEGFYARQGFERIGEAETRFGKAATMRKRLPAP